jgi:pyruvate dehydrogenase E1 component alpha subunit
MDVLSVYEETGAAVNQARTEHLPALLEIRTYRYKGHSMSDPGKYRSKDELENYRKQDPILLLKDALLGAEKLTEDEFAAMDVRCRQVAQDAADFAENSPEPELETRFEDVLA